VTEKPFIFISTEAQTSFLSSSHVDCLHLWARSKTVWSAGFITALDQSVGRALYSGISHKALGGPKCCILHIEMSHGKENFTHNFVLCHHSVVVYLIMFNPLQNMNFSGAPLFWKQRLRDKVIRVHKQDMEIYIVMEILRCMERWKYSSTNKGLTHWMHVSGRFEGPNPFTFVESFPRQLCRMLGYMNCTGGPSYPRFAAYRKKFGKLKK